MGCNKVYKNHAKNMLLSIDRCFSGRYQNKSNMCWEWCLVLCGERQGMQAIWKDLHATRLRESAARV